MTRSRVLRSTGSEPTPGDSPGNGSPTPGPRLSEPEDKESMAAATRQLLKDRKVDAEQERLKDEAI